MNPKNNGATVLGKRGGKHCLICLAEGESKSAARKCDGVHFHQFCGSMIVAKRKGLTCGQKHPQSTIVGYTKKTKKEALPHGETRHW